MPKTFGEKIEQRAQKYFTLFKKTLKQDKPLFEGDPFFDDPLGMSRLDLVNALWVAQRTLQRFDELVAAYMENEGEK